MIVKRSFTTHLFGVSQVQKPYRASTNGFLTLVSYNFCKKCLTFPCGSGIVNKLSQEIASEILKNK